MLLKKILKWVDNNNIASNFWKICNCFQDFLTVQQHNWSDFFYCFFSGTVHITFFSSDCFFCLFVRLLACWLWCHHITFTVKFFCFYVILYIFMYYNFLKFRFLRNWFPLYMFMCKHISVCIHLQGCISTLLNVKYILRSLHLFVLSIF